MNHFFLDFPKMLPWYCLALAGTPAGPPQNIWMLEVLVRYPRNHVRWAYTCLAHISRPMYTLLAEFLPSLQRKSLLRTPGEDPWQAGQGPQFKERKHVRLQVAVYHVSTRAGFRCFSVCPGSSNLESWRWYRWSSFTSRENTSAASSTALGCQWALAWASSLMCPLLCVYARVCVLWETKQNCPVHRGPNTFYGFLSLLIQWHDRQVTA